MWFVGVRSGEVATVEGQLGWEGDLPTTFYYTAKVESNDCFARMHGYCVSNRLHFGGARKQ